MNPPLETAPGLQRGWNLLEKLGEGDAGEVYRVESLIDRRPAVLKRPRRSSFPSDLIRQATQIEKEANILSALTTIDSPARLMHVPALIDRSRPGTEFTERFFIVISPAPGFSLSQLARRIHFQNGSTPPEGENPTSQLLPEERYLLDELARLDKIPELLTLRALGGLIEFLETIHAFQFDLPSGPAYGVVWNDVKPDHIYWDAKGLRFTLIDWGNAQFVDEDGISKDRQHSRMGDYAQFMSEMGSFLSSSSPQMLQDLGWPEDDAPANLYSSSVLPIREKVKDLLQTRLLERRQVRRAETDLVSQSSPTPGSIQKLRGIQQQVISLGEIPDFQAAESLYRRVAKMLVEAQDLEAFVQLCAQLEKTPLIKSEQYLVLSHLAHLVAKGEIPSKTLLYGLESEWPAALWEARLASLQNPDCAWWDEISSRMRELEIGSSVLRPFVATNRLVHALQALKISQDGEEICEALLRQFSDEVLPRWRQLEPDPPDAGIEYKDAEGALQSAATLLPDASQSVFHSLSQAQSQVQIALDAWQRQDFRACQNALQRVMLWDPDRIRLVQAHRSLGTAERWLDEVRTGLTHDEPLTDFITRQELVGRDLRSQIAPADWLDNLLDAFKQLRKGADPTDVLVAHPDLLTDLDWLISLEPRRPLMASPGKVLQLERKASLAESRPTLYGMQEAALGKRQGILLSEPLDTWAPEARGSSARIFLGSVPSVSDSKKTVAIKVMRPDRLEYALPLFREEAHVLSLLREVGGVIPLVECGFIHLGGEELPAEERDADAGGLSGSALRYGLDSMHNFLADLDKKAGEGWLPYLALEKYERQDNLLLLCDTGYTNGRFLPTLEGLIMAIQICEILEAAHLRSIIYRDHKILHYYWLEEYNGTFMIDWNVAKRYPEGLSVSEIQFDLVQFGARALHYILTGRSAQGALPLGPNKPEEIEAAARTYPVSWTYDDQRLPRDIKDVLEAVLSGGYSSARQLKEDLNAIYEKLSVLV